MHKNRLATGIRREPLGTYSSPPDPIGGSGKAAPRPKEAARRPVKREGAVRVGREREGMEMGRKKIMKGKVERKWERGCLVF